MGTILESTIILAQRFGIDYEEMTIKDMLDAIVQKLDDTYPGSIDIAEAVRELAKNDGPDARLGTKSITANRTYIALDDELDGYSSVSVNVPSSTPRSMIRARLLYNNGGTLSERAGYILYAENGAYNVPAGTTTGTYFTLSTPAKSIYLQFTNGSVLFTPDENFTGFTYEYGKSVEMAGDDITAGDGKIYYATWDEHASSVTVTITKKSTNFDCYIVG